MKNLQLKYTIVSMLFAVINCILYGFAAIYLQMRGLSNTQIGIVTGGGPILLILFSSRITSLTQKIKGLTARKLCIILHILIAVCIFLVLGDKLPLPVVMISYMIALLLQLTVMPITSNMAMEYIQNGVSLNFGLSKGLGSFSFAIAAMVLSRAVGMYGANIVMWICLIAIVGIIIALWLLPEVSLTEKQSKGLPVIAFFKKYHVYVWMLIGFTFCYMATTALDTYLINIVTHLGGSTTVFGIGTFLASASELPVMAMTPWLKKRFGAYRVLAVAAVVFVIRNFVICLAPNLSILMLGQMLKGASYGLLIAMTAYYVADYLDAKDQMFGMTCVTIFTGGISRTVGNVACGALQDFCGVSGMYVFCCIVVMIGCGIVLWKVKTYIVPNRK